MKLVLMKIKRISSFARTLGGNQKKNWNMYKILNIHTAYILDGSSDLKVHQYYIKYNLYCF